MEDDDLLEEESMFMSVKGNNSHSNTKKRKQEEIEAEDNESDEDNSEMMQRTKMDVDEDEDDEDAKEGDEEEEEIPTDEQISELRRQVQTNVYDYEGHKAYIRALRRVFRKSGPELRYLRELRDARESMSKIFPLTEELWVEWINDESDANLDSASMISLFQQALEDYLSPKIWYFYAAYLMGDLNVDFGEIRRVFEEALVLVQHHFTKADLIWSAYIEFEKIIPAAGDDIQKKIDRIRNLYNRCISIPHRQLDSTFEAYCEWEMEASEVEKAAEANIKKMNAIYTKVKEGVATRESLEAELETTDNSLETFLSYIDFEKKQKEDKNRSFRLRTLYERALCTHCLKPEIWLQYIFFLVKNIKVSEVLLRVHKRSIRNCPWSGDLWSNYILSLERFNKPKEMIDEIYGQALGSGIQTVDEACKIYITYCDYIRRQTDYKDENQVAILRQTFEDSINSIKIYFVNDPSSRLELYFARIEAGKLNNIEKARKILNEALEANSGSTNLWLEFIQIERMWGDIGKCSRLFKQAVSKQLDDPYRLYVEWVTFERENGTLDEYDFAAEKVQLHTEILYQQQVKVYEKEQKKLAEAAAAAAERETDKKSTKRKRGKEGKRDATREKRARTAPPPSDGKELKPFVNEDMRDYAVFVSNLGFNEDEHSVRYFFETEKKCGIVTAVHLNRDPVTKKSQGFGDVQFEQKESVVKALQQDREKLNGRPVFVSPWINKKKGESVGFQYPTGKDENTVFVANLPLDMEKAQIEALFSPIGELKDVRHVMKKSGRSRGIAYVEFTNRNDANRAVEQLNGHKVGDNAISVIISDPKRKEASSTSYSRGYGRSMISLVPRSVAVQKQSPVTAAAAASPSPSAESSTASTETTTASATKKSNADFRKMFLGS